MQPISTLATNIDYFIHSRDLAPVLIKSALLAIANIGLGFAIAYFAPLSGVVGLAAAVKSMSSWQRTVSFLTVSGLSTIFQITILPLPKEPVYNVERFLASAGLRARIIKTVALTIIFSIAVSVSPLCCLNQAIVMGLHGISATVCSGLFIRYVLAPFVPLSPEVKTQIDTIMAKNRAKIDLLLNEMQERINTLIAENQRQIDAIAAQKPTRIDQLSAQLRTLRRKSPAQIREIANANSAQISLNYRAIKAQFESVTAHNPYQNESIKQEYQLRTEKMYNYVNSRRLEIQNAALSRLALLNAQRPAPPPLSNPICDLQPSEEALYTPDSSTPAEFICPISLHIIYDPVLIVEGTKLDEATGKNVPHRVAYERNLIQRVYNMKGRTPATRSLLSDPSELPTDEALKDRIQAYIDARRAISA